MVVCVRIRDSKGNDISNNCLITSDYSEYGDILKIQLLDETHFKDNFYDDDIYLLKDLVEEKIKYGDYVPKIRKLMEVYDKLEKLLKENSINE